MLEVKREIKKRILPTAEETDFKSNLELKGKTPDKGRPTLARRKNCP